jgi:hypothetical protein
MAECAPFGTYSFRQVAFTIDGALVTGFDEGDDCIMIEPRVELVTSKDGADGSSIDSISASQSADVTIRLLPHSPFNAFLRNKVLRMRGDALTGIRFPVGFTDLSNGETGGCTNAMVKKEPTINRGVAASTVEWVFSCPCWQPGVVAVNAA